MVSTAPARLSPPHPTAPGLRQNNPTGKISLNPSGKSALPACPILSRQEGRSRVVTNAGGDAMDAGASARNGVAGRVSRERSIGAQDERRFQRTAKPCGPDTRCWCQAVGGKIDPTGSDPHQAGSDGDKTNSLAGESTA